MGDSMGKPTASDQQGTTSTRRTDGLAPGRERDAQCRGVKVKTLAKASVILTFEDLGSRSEHITGHAEGEVWRDAESSVDHGE